jgi:hypothetical protein
LSTRLRPKRTGDSAESLEITLFWCLQQLIYCGAGRLAAQKLKASTTTMSSRRHVQHAASAGNCNPCVHTFAQRPGYFARASKSFEQARISSPISHSSVTTTRCQSRDSHVVADFSMSAVLLPHRSSHEIIAVNPFGRPCLLSSIRHG